MASFSTAFSTLLLRTMANKLIKSGHLLAYSFALMNLCAMISPLYAASFNVNPVKFQFSSPESIAVLQIANAGDEPLRLQINVMNWSTDGKTEVLTDSDDLLINPPIFLLAPNKTQYVRFGLRSPSIDSTKEKSYRLMVEEVPLETPRGGGLHTVLRFSLPVFFAPRELEEELSWKVQKHGSAVTLVAENDGNVHTKINTLMLSSDDNKTALKVATPSYILPGQHKEWPIESMPASATRFRLAVSTEDGEKEETLVEDGE